jgi:hypothetical protein
MYQAGDYVNLDVGFTAESGTDFTARIGGCNDFPERMQPENDEWVFGRLTVFPNPSPDGIFTVLLPVEASGARLVIHDVTGKLIFSGDDVS